MKNPSPRLSRLPAVSSDSRQKAPRLGSEDMLRRVLGRPLLASIHRHEPSSIIRLVAAGGNSATVSFSRALSTEAPEFNVVKMPSLSPTMEKGKIIEWIVPVGEEISAGDTLCTIETDKTVTGFDFQEDAIVAKYLIEAGDDEVNCKVPIAITVDDIEAFEAFKAADAAGLIVVDYDSSLAASSTSPATTTDVAPPGPAVTTSSSPTESIVAAVAAATPITSVSGGERVFASPLARRMARDKGFEIR